MNPMMKCGCAAQAVDQHKNPVCIVHDCKEIASDLNLAGRIARCAYCGETRSSPDRECLAFFRHRPDRKFDEFYCGCRGWD